MQTLNAEKREAGNVSALRNGGRIPAVLYGKKENATPISVSLIDFSKVWAEVGGSGIVNLTGVGDEKETLIQDVALDPVTGVPIHADFFVLEKGKKVRVTVPLHFEGIAPAEKLGGIVVKVVHEIEMEVAPKEIPHHIVVDLSSLVTLESEIILSQLSIPASAEVDMKKDEVIVSITVPVEEKEEVVRTAADVEISEKGKKPEEGNEGTSTAEADSGAQKKTK